MKNKIIQKVPIIIEDEDLPILWVDEFNTETATEFGKGLLKLESDPDTSEIFIYITSYGGEIFPLLSMIDMIRNCSKPVHTVCSGMAMSAGAFLMTSSTGTRWMAKNSYLLIHHIRSWHQGDSPSQEQDLKHTKASENRLFSIMAERSVLTSKGIKSKLKEENREWQLSANEALKYGFIDKIGMPSIKKYLVTEYE